MTIMLSLNKFEDRSLYHFEMYYINILTVHIYDKHSIYNTLLLCVSHFHQFLDMYPFHALNYYKKEPDQSTKAILVHG